MGRRDTAGLSGGILADFRGVHLQEEESVGGIYAKAGQSPARSQLRNDA